MRTLICAPQDNIRTKMATSMFTKNWFFKVISVYVFCFACLISSSTIGLNTKSVKRAGKVMLVFIPFVFSVSYFVVWRILVLKPMKSYASVWQVKETKLAGRFLFDVWTAMLFVFLLLTHLSLPYMIFMGKATEVGTVSYILFVCLGTFFVLISVVVAFELLEFFLRITILKGLQWKWFQKNWCTIRVVAVTVIVCGVVAVSLVIAAKGPVVKPVELPVRKLPSSMSGLRIVQLSDIHLGPTVGRSQLQQSVNTANSLKPDIVVITGDLVDSTVEFLTEAVSPLKQLRATHGVFFVTGNHEYYTYDVKNWQTHLESLGVVCLPNRFVRIISPETPQDWFYLAGTNDLEARNMYNEEDHFNLDKALEDTDSDHAVILLAHQPKAAQRAVQSQYDISLILSGHTHGGQMFPFNIVMYFISPYYAGVYQPKEGTYVYVSSGTWYNGPPMRLFSRAEITLITLLSS